MRFTVRKRTRRQWVSLISGAIVLTVIGAGLLWLLVLLVLMALGVVGNSEDHVAGRAILGFVVFVGIFFTWLTTSEY